MQSPAERHNYILNTLRIQGYVTVAGLCQDMNVSEATVRRDLRNLEARDLLYRTHGGANPTHHHIYDRPVSEKAGQYAEEKRRIGAAAARLVEPHDSVILGSGTTVIQVAKHLASTSHLSIVTNAMNVALELVHLPQAELFILGGLVRLTSTSAVGPVAETMMARFACRKLFLGVDGFDLEHGLTTSNALEAHLNQRMIIAAQETIIVTDSSKFGLRGFSHICNLDTVDKVITDSNLPEAFATGLLDAGIEVIQA